MMMNLAEQVVSASRSWGGDMVPPTSDLISGGNQIPDTYTGHGRTMCMSRAVWGEHDFAKIKLALCM